VIALAKDQNQICFFLIRHHLPAVPIRGSMKKSELLRALQSEIQKHNLSTFMSDQHKIVQTGCSACQKHFGTVEQFKRHLSEDVLPPLLDKLSTDVPAT